MAARMSRCGQHWPDDPKGQERAEMPKTPPKQAERGRKGRTVTQMATQSSQTARKIGTKTETARKPPKLPGNHRNDRETTEIAGKIPKQLTKPPKHIPIKQ